MCEHVSSVECVCVMICLSVCSEKGAAKRNEKSEISCKTHGLARSGDQRPRIRLKRNRMQCVGMSCLMYMCLIVVTLCSYMLSGDVSEGAYSYYPFMVARKSGKTLLYGSGAKSLTQSFMVGDQRKATHAHDPTWCLLSSLEQSSEQGEGKSMKTTYVNCVGRRWLSPFCPLQPVHSIGCFVLTLVDQGGQRGFSEVQANQSIKANSIQC